MCLFQLFRNPQQQQQQQAAAAASPQQLQLLAAQQQYLAAQQGETAEASVIPVSGDTKHCSHACACGHLWSSLPVAILNTVPMRVPVVTQCSVPSTLG